MKEEREQAAVAEDIRRLGEIMTGPAHYIGALSPTRELFVRPSVCRRRELDPEATTKTFSTIHPNVCYLLLLLLLALPLPVQHKRNKTTCSLAQEQNSLAAHHPPSFLRLLVDAWRANNFYLEPQTQKLEASSWVNDS